jgi:hypothetical protein
MAHLADRPMYEFRLPTTELNRGFRKWGFTMLIALVLAHFFLPNGIGGELIFLPLAVGVAGYLYAKQHIWLSLSPDGISGSGYTNRKIKIAWRDTVTINKARVSAMDGFEVRASANDSFVKKQILSLFIPRAIADSPEFSAAVAELAPAGHSLRAVSNDAP